MAANLTKEQRAEKRRRAWSLRMRGWTEQRIADDLGVNQSTVSRYLDQLTRRAIDNLERRVNREFLATLGLLDHAIDEAVQAWERSKKPKRKASKRSGPAGTGPGSGEQTTVEETAREGDPAFLTIALSATDRKRTLLALDERFAPPKEDDQARGGMNVADALALAEARDDEFRPDIDTDTDDEETADDADPVQPAPAAPER